MIKRIMIFAIASILTVFWVERGNALSITPMPVIFAQGEKVANFSIGDDDNQYEAHVYKVEVTPTGTEELKKTDDIVVYPLVFKAPRIMRLSIRKPFPRNVEGYYRLVLSQLPLVPEQGIRTVLAFSIPVLVAPKKIIEKKEVICGDTIVIKNEGTVHQKFLTEKSFIYVPAGMTVSIPKTTLKYGDTIICQGEAK